MYCLETKKISHQFHGHSPTLDNIDLKVTEGSIYGFLGPNGAGKTTTLKLILGLLEKQHGEILIFGKPFEKNRTAILKNVGSLIESPSIYAHLTAHENLSLLQKIYQCPATRIKAVLNLVGLQDTGNKKAGRFSLGMKQRLSIAIALLHNPKLLILDEPTNGLDPYGIIEMRTLLKKLNRESGITIIISSHLLGEIEKLVSHIGIINKGRMVFEGTIEALKKSQKQAITTVLQTNNDEKAIALLQSNGWPMRCDDEQITLPALDKETVASINELLVSNGIKVYAIGTQNNDLEALFMNLLNT